MQALSAASRALEQHGELEKASHFLSIMSPHKIKLCTYQRFDCRLQEMEKGFAAAQPVVEAGPAAAAAEGEEKHAASLAGIATSPSKLQLVLGQNLCRARSRAWTFRMPRLAISQKPKRSAGASDYC